MSSGEMQQGDVCQPACAGIPAGRQQGFHVEAEDSDVVTALEN